jgi:signal transduction histidine kinase
LDARDVEVLQETIDRLRLELAELRASRKRLLLAAYADRRRMERELHEGVQQHLVALAVNLQLAGQLASADPAAATALLEEMGRDVQQALDETAQLAQRIYPPIEAGGLAAAMRSAAASAGIPASVEIAADASYPPEVVVALHSCWLDAIERAASGAAATVTLRDEDGALAFGVLEDGDQSDAGLELLRDRLEALGGRLAIRSERGRRRVSGSLPVSG